MPVGTLATVKGVTASQLQDTGAQMVLANTYHLHLQPGEQIVADAGGLHRFMGWSGPLLTDSGGFQVFSLGDINKIDDRGVVFRSPRDGARITLTPERSMEIQMALGADVAMAFDQCPPYPASEADVEVACRRTHAWLERCIATYTLPMKWYHLEPGRHSSSCQLCYSGHQLERKETYPQGLNGQGGLQNSGVESFNTSYRRASTPPTG